MNEAIIIWLYLSLGKFFGVSWVLIGIGVTALIIYALITFVEGGSYSIERDVWVYDKEKEQVKTVFKYVPMKTIFMILLLSFFFPSKSDLKYIIGGAAVWNGVEAAQDIKGVEKLPENIVGAMNHFLEKTQEEK